MLINGHTELIAHIGYPTHSFKAPLIYNPYFEANNINALVMPFSCETHNFSDLFTALWKTHNLRGMLITMPHKINVVSLLDEVSTRVAISGACNAVKKQADGRLVGDMFDGEGYVLGIKNKGISLDNARILLIGAGGVGSAIAASLAQESITELHIVDPNRATREALASRLKNYYPDITIHTSEASPSPRDMTMVINASPLGMNLADPLPIDVRELSKHTFVGEVVLSQTLTPLLQHAKEIGCAFQVGTDMLFEQIPAYLEFFNYPSTTAYTLKALAKLNT